MKARTASATSASSHSSFQPSFKIETILAFDFGEKTIGVAVGDTETRTASALGTASAATFDGIDALVREWRPARLVVGLPLTLEGGAHGMTARSRRFARRLAARYRLPVDFADERLSSASAEESLRDMGLGGRRNKHRVHAEAARIILQGYLDERRPA